ncbi:RNA polymerase sigma-70 factor [Niastella caeni]|uniref:RNA polymerase sigma-70 factor n=1 Tax=Niastella caeni TaxID=2569763 RepID=A0A4S8HVC0_9BACT|nr:RNA polymerase sigma-70 factor [Niastella caeni]THU39567.1 RNA polymerase sigma-70 factor [Niastella caeni]
MNATDDIVWQQIRERNMPAFESYYKEHFKTYFLVAYKFVKSVPVAQEIVNDVFLKIWEDAGKIMIESSLKAYIYKAVVNRSINVLNKQQKELQNQRALALLPPEFYEETQLETNELKAQLYKAIENLPEQCKKVFQLSRFEGLKQQEIADKLGLSIKTVKNHITQALKTLARYSGKSMVLFLIVKLFL